MQCLSSYKAKNRKRVIKTAVNSNIMPNLTLLSTDKFTSFTINQLVCLYTRKMNHFLFFEGLTYMFFSKDMATNHKADTQ